jgi:hypothetical protein
VTGRRHREYERNFAQKGITVMKNSRRSLGSGKALVAAMFLALGLTTLGWTPAVMAQSSDAGAAGSQQYAPWSGSQQGKASQKLLKELKAALAQAEADQAASPDFLADLRAIIGRYETAVTASDAKPFIDTFADGEFASNPTWKVTAGSWQVDKSGSNIGLVSKIRQQASLNSLLGNILNPQAPAQQDAQQYAAIYTKAKLPGTFAARVKLTSRDRYGGLYVSLYQGASAQNQYRLAYQPGSNQGLLLQLVSASGATTLGSYNGAVNLEDGRAHDIGFSRNGAGQMTITVDGAVAINAVDASLKGGFDGILLTNVGGSYWLREISVQPQP